MRPSAQRLRILHISDLHLDARTARDGSARPIDGEPWAKNLHEILAEGPIDLVCCTGDLTYSGHQEQLQGAGRFLQDLGARLGLERERVFVVPGNHDVDRRVEPSPWRALREALAGGVDEEAFSRWIADRGAPPPGFAPHWRERVFLRGQHFRAWVREGLGREDLDPRRSPHGRLGFRAEVEGRWGFRLQVIGLDSAWLAGDETDRGNLRITTHRITALTAAGEDDDPQPPLRVVMVHHPLGPLVDGAACRRLLAERASLVLHGHSQVAGADAVQVVAGELVEIAAGTLRAGRWLPTRCNVVTITADERGVVEDVEVAVRGWSEHGAWYEEARVQPLPRRGSRRPAPRAANEEPQGAFDPWRPAPPDALLGREPQIERILAALGHGIPVSLLGLAGIGKTSLLGAIAERARAMGRVVRRVNGAGPAGLSTGAFVEAVTGEPAPEHPERAAIALHRWASSGERILVVDDAEGLFERLDPRFAARLLDLGLRTWLLFAASAPLEAPELQAKLRVASWLDLLDEPATDQLVERAAPWLRPGDAERMREQAGRHPFFLHLFGRHLVTARRAGLSDAALLDGFRADAAARLRAIWHDLDAWERDALRDACAGTPVRRTPRLCALLTERGAPFGRALAEWIERAAP